MVPKSDVMPANVDPSEVSLPMGSIIGLIGSVRNDLIEELLDDVQLSSYYREQFNKELSEIKRKFLRMKLKDLLRAPIDLVHYSKLIKQIKETNTASLTAENSGIFYEEMHSVFNRHVI